MTSLNGKISDRLRKLFTTDQILSNPHPDRSASPKKTPVPKYDKGQQLSKSDRKTKRSK